jgi:Zn-dependent M16 (insulinase) family peptidase
MLTGQGSYNYFFELNQRVLGRQNPFSFYSAGVPDEMRSVTPQQIRDFHEKHYRLGPTTGFIFALDPHKNVAAFLGRVSEELKSVPMAQSGTPVANAGQPKYPVSPDSTNQIAIYPFPGANESDPGEVRFSWKSMEVDSRIELRLLQLFFRTLAEGERSLLYKSLIDSKTRELDSGATAAESEPFLSNSPHFPVWNVGLSGIPGNRISLQRVGEFRDLICKKIREISEYPDDSTALRALNELVTSYSLAWRRVEKVWVKNAPDFGVRGAGFTWKEYLNALEIEPSFHRSISEESLWQEVDHQLRSGKNIWRDLILKFHLSEPPYATASLPSAQLLERLEDQRRTRIHQKLQSLMAQYHTEDEQQALAQFESGERAKIKEIAEIQAKVRRPRFTDHPPLTWDDSIHYRQFTFPGGVPAVASLFERPPTINLGLAFDLKKVPKQYYKYLPILARCFDALGVREGDTVTDYPELLTQIRTSVYDLWAGYEFDALARRGDLAFRVTGTNLEEFRRGLELLRKVLWSNYLDIANADRLRDIIDQRISNDDSFTKQGEEYWIPNPAYSFLHQDDSLFFALNSQFTWAHWDWRLKWRMHKLVDPKEIDALVDFSNRLLASSGADSRQQFAERLRRSNASGLQRELVDYWSRNLAAFPDNERTEVLRQLTGEVQEDLRAGPAQTIEELKRLETTVLDRRALHIDLTLSPEILREVQPDLTALI